ncbi:MAG: nuclease [Nitrospira sp.]|nr:nuclease [Nitrospira sp.]
MRKGFWITTKLLSAIVLIALIITGYPLLTLSGENPRGEWVLVTEVIDGDTIYVKRGWESITVRLIGVDTPETVHPEKPVEFFGPEASEFTKRRLEGKKVRLELEPSNQYDAHGRLLAYIFLIDGTLFNAELIKQGYARVIAPSPFHRYKEFRRYEREARTAGLGLWAAKVKVLQPPTETSGKIIGNRLSKIYHLLGQANYGRVKEENRVYFDAEKDAIKAGYRRAKK